MTTNEISNGMNKVFSGPNGHYVAWEDASGTHYQQSGGNGWWSEDRKKRELEAANSTDYYSGSEE